MIWSLDIITYCIHVHVCVVGKVYDPPAARELSTGGGVRVELDPELFKVAQEDHGGWEDYMAEVLTCSRNMFL